MKSSWHDDFPLHPSLTSLSLRIRFTVISGRWTALFLLLQAPLCCCQMLSPLPSCWSSPKQREWSVWKPRDLFDSASFGLSINSETNVISPCTPYWQGPCVFFFPTLPTIGKELSYYEENSREVQRKMAGFFVSLWWELGKRCFSSSCSFLQILFKGSQSS